MKLLAILSVFLVSACAGSPHVLGPVTQAPPTISVCYSSLSASPRQVTQLAAQQCASVNMQVVGITSQLFSPFTCSVGTPIRVQYQCGGALPQYSYGSDMTQPPVSLTSDGAGENLSKAGMPQGLHPYGNLDQTEFHSSQPVSRSKPENLAQKQGHHI